MSRKRKTPKKSSRQHSREHKRAHPEIRRSPESDPGTRTSLEQQRSIEEQESRIADAMELMDQVQATGDPDERLRLATRALELWPECSEAYLCLAEMAPEAGMAMDFFQAAADTAAQCLGGDSVFEGDLDQRWGEPETNTYLEARLGLARVLWSTGEPEQAIDECCDVLDLDPADRIGARCLLCFYYLQQGFDEDLGCLLDRFPEDMSAELRFTRALLAFRTPGDSGFARQLLQEAHRGNPHAANLLLFVEDLPEQLPTMFRQGERDEAVLYAHDYRACWRDTEGALPWLRETLKCSRKNLEKRKATPWGHLKASVEDLPQDADTVWQVDVRRMPAEGPARLRPWSQIILNEERQFVAIESVPPEKKPTPRETLEFLVRAMRKPQFGDSYRPTAVCVRQKSLLRAWQTRLEDIGVLCRLVDATEWIDDVMQDIEQYDQARSVSDDELAERSSELDQLPLHEDEVWQADIIRMACWIEDEGIPQRPWLVVVANSDSSMIMSHDLSLESRSPELLWNAIQKAMLVNPSVEACRPGIIEVASEDFADALRGRLEPLGVQVTVHEQLDQLMAIKHDMESAFGDEDEMVALVDTPMVTTTHVAGVFQAAADFYYRRPWRDVEGDAPIQLVYDRDTSNTWYAVVMGQSGMAQGVALYEDPDVLRALLWDEPDADRRNAGLSVMYGEAFEISPRDLEAAERHGWSIAGPQAHPLFLRINPGMAVRPMLAWELALTEAALRAIPVFLRHVVDTETKLTVPTATGQMTLTASWWEP